MSGPILDRSDARARLLARARDEAAGPPSAGISPTPEVAMRCTDHGTFILWVSPPAPPGRVECPPKCGDAS